ncbi:MAG TPA: acylphosphatase [Candidatus Sabulitectum sp.]|nr:acylphosphatase [Candidatus Sabulitectum sp.]HRW77947.1 acylphosphatase [Candidatus Sabulitectum sp.]
MDDGGMNIRVLLRVRGMVQGVGFRYWTRARAVELSLGGYVRNLPDGSVEAMLRGPADSVELLMKQMTRGPSHAVVRGIEVLEREKTQEAVGEFRISR